jgi:hypothetical protein
MIAPSFSRLLGALLCLSYAVSLGGCKRLPRCPEVFSEEPAPKEGCVEYRSTHGHSVGEEIAKWEKYVLNPFHDKYFGQAKYWGNTNEWARQSWEKFFRWFGEPPHPFEWMYYVGDQAPSIYDPTPFHSIINFVDPDWVGPLRPTPRWTERFYLADCQSVYSGEVVRQWSEMLVGRTLYLLLPQFLGTGG